MNQAVKALSAQVSNMSQQITAGRKESIDMVFYYLENAAIGDLHARQICAWLTALFNHQPVKMVLMRSWPASVRCHIYGILSSYCTDDISKADYARLSKVQERFSYVG